jgi:hypothetical protein
MPKNDHLIKAKLNQFYTRDIIPSGLISHEFLNLGLPNIGQAIQYIHALPYSRNSNRANYRLVLKEGCGTCSTKHALLAALAKEQGIDLSLKLGLFELNATNTPAIKSILEQYQLNSILEAHCYLAFEACRFDITFPEKLALLNKSDFQEEFTITPGQIGNYKVCLHQQAIRTWLKNKKLTYNFEAFWQLREVCIDKISKN